MSDCFCSIPLNDCLCGGKAVWRDVPSRPGTSRICPTCSVCNKAGSVTSSASPRPAAEVWNMLNKPKQGKKNMKPTKKSKKK